MNLMNEPKTVYFDISKAVALVAHLNTEEEEGWTYKLKSNGNAAVIEVYDEDGYLLGNL